MQAFVSDGTPLSPGEEVVYNYEKKGSITILSSEILSKTIFRKKYEMKDLTTKMESYSKFKPDFFKKAFDDYTGKELYENQTLLENPVYSKYRGYEGCLEEEAQEFELLCNTTYDES